jgi:hypothetical protein
MADWASAAPFDWLTGILKLGLFPRLHHRQKTPEELTMNGKKKWEPVARPP